MKGEFIGFVDGLDIGVKEGEILGKSFGFVFKWFDNVIIYRDVEGEVESMRGCEVGFGWN